MAISNYRYQHVTFRYEHVTFLISTYGLLSTNRLNHHCILFYVISSPFSGSSLNFKANSINSGLVDCFSQSNPHLNQKPTSKSLRCLNRPNVDRLGWWIAVRISFKPLSIRPSVVWPEINLKFKKLRSKHEIKLSPFPIMAGNVIDRSAIKQVFQTIVRIF